MVVTLKGRSDLRGGRVNGERIPESPQIPQRRVVTVKIDRDNLVLAVTASETRCEILRQGIVPVLMTQRAATWNLGEDPARSLDAGVFAGINGNKRRRPKRGPNEECHAQPSRDTPARPALCDLPEAVESEAGANGEHGHQRGQVAKKLGLRQGDHQPIPREPGQHEGLAGPPSAKESEHEQRHPDERQGSSHGSETPPDELLDLIEDWGGADVLAGERDIEDAPDDIRLLLE